MQQTINFESSKAATNLSSHKPLIQTPIEEFVEKSYLEYAMYVILDRALPSIADGLKPVQRRIVYAMSELGLNATAKHKKSARTIGDVLGKFHPHGDMACYEAMVLMAQNFTYRYPLIDGQGNWGSIDDPKSFAAMRYTESRLSKYANYLLQELSEDTTEWTLNFDGTLQEPKTLPAQLPNILLNGASGIAVGMSTNIPPHNLTDLLQTLIFFLNAKINKQEVELKDLFHILKGPDYPSGAEIITPKEELLEIYQIGHGSIRQRATYKVENDKKQKQIIINNLPYQISANKIIIQIAELIQNKKLPMLTNVVDESDEKEPVRIKLALLGKKVSIDDLMSHLFVVTDLETSYKINFNIIGLNGKPEVKNLKKILDEWLTYRIATLKRKYQFRKDKIQNRLHILKALTLIYIHLDEVIAIIRHEDKPKQILMKKFELDETQVDAILNLRLRMLAKIEAIALEKEAKQLKNNLKEINALLTSNSKLQKQLIIDLKAIKDDFAKDKDARKSLLTTRQQAKSLDESKLIQNEAITIILSNQGWVRLAKGRQINGKDLTYKNQDDLLWQTEGNLHDKCLAFDIKGRAYSLEPIKLPSARGHGEPISAHIKNTNPIQSLVLFSEKEKQKKYLLFAAQDGYGFIAPIANCYSKNSSGKQILNSDKALPVQNFNKLDEQYIAILTNEPRLLVIKANELPILNKGKGNKLIELKSKNVSYKIIANTILKQNQRLKISTKKTEKILTKNEVANAYGKRASKGATIARTMKQAIKMEAID